jgi:hypothetical protein
MTQTGHWEASGELRPKSAIGYFQLVNLTRYNALS